MSSNKPVRRPSDGKVRVYGLGWVKPRTAVMLVILAVVLWFLVFKYHV